jgi:hypothetical protein
LESLLQTATGLGDKIYAQISKNVGGVAQGLGIAAQKLGKGGKAAIIGSIAKTVGKL